MVARHVTRDPIDPGALLAAVADPARGATALFTGTVRRSPEDGPVRHIEYSAYEEMLEEEFARILAEARTGHASAVVAAVHRLGAVPVGAASIAVAAAAPHRAEAFAACRWVMEEAKRRLPVWKREVLDDGREAWRDNTGARAPAGEAHGPEHRPH